jgi:hypothetical protein
MARRTKRGAINKHEAMTRLQEGRRGAQLVCAQAKIESGE